MGTLPLRACSRDQISDMVLEDERTGRGIPHISGGFNSKLVARLNRAPGDIMGFLEACAMGNQARVEELLEKGVDVNTTGVPSDSALPSDVLSSTSGLMIATMAQQVEVVERLLEEKDLDVDRRGKNGETALTIGALQGSDECVSLLLRAGADVTSVNDSGKSALGLAADHARMEDFLEIAGSLVIAGCRGTDKDWEILGKYPQKKLLVLLEELRSYKERNTLKYLARRAVMNALRFSCAQSNPGARISQLELPRNLKDYLHHPV